MKKVISDLRELAQKDARENDKNIAQAQQKKAQEILRNVNLLAESYGIDTEAVKSWSKKKQEILSGEGAHIILNSLEKCYQEYYPTPEDRVKELNKDFQVLSKLYDQHGEYVITAFASYARMNEVAIKPESFQKFGNEVDKQRFISDYVEYEYSRIRNKEWEGLHPSKPTYNVKEAADGALLRSPSQTKISVQA